MRRWVQLGGFLIAFVVNPGYFSACVAGSGPDFGEAEMLAVLDAANAQETWQFDAEGRSYAVDVSLLQTKGDDAFSGRSTPAWASRAFACGNRRFMNSASACITRSEVGVIGEVTLREVAPSARVIAVADVEGSLWTDAARLLFATIDLEFEGGSIGLHSDDAKRFEVQRVQWAAADGSERIEYGTGVPRR
jgi:hypothetical protein